MKNLLKGIEVLVFDLDGVILDSPNRGKRDMQEFARENGLRVPNDQELGKLWGLPLIKVVKIIWPENDPDQLRNQYKKTISDKKKRYPLVPDVLSALFELKRAGLILTILTNRGSESLLYHLDGTEILNDGLFDFIATTDITPVENPEKTFKETLAYLKQLNISKNQIVFIGDTIHDVRVAQTAQIEFIGVLTGAAIKEEFEEAGVEYILKSAANLPQFISSNL